MEENKEKKIRSKYLKLLLNLVQPDENGCSRVFYPSEFIEEYEILAHNNGCNWARQVRKFFKLKINHENDTKNGDVVSYQLKGFQENRQFNESVATWIRKWFDSQKGKRSAWSGIPCDKDYELDHNKGVKNDPRISNTDTQLISDFQILTPSENKCKREMCAKCKATAKRPKGSEIFVGCSVDYTQGTEKLQWNRETHDWDVNACSGCCLNDITQWRKDAEFITKYGAIPDECEEKKNLLATHLMNLHDRDVIVEYETKKAKMKFGE